MEGASGVVDIIVIPVGAIHHHVAVLNHHNITVVSRASAHSQVSTHVPNFKGSG